MFNSTNFNNDYFNRYGTNSNVTYVTSLEDALSRNNYPNTENTYFHQDKPIFYRVRTDYAGKKFWQAFEYGPSTATEDSTPVAKGDLTEIVERLKRLEDYVFQPEVPNE